MRNRAIGDNNKRPAHLGKNPQDRSRTTLSHPALLTPPQKPYAARSSKGRVWAWFLIDLEDFFRGEQGRLLCRQSRDTH